MMKVTFETNAGTFVGYLTSTGKIEIYENVDEEPIAIIEPLPRRKAVPDVTADGVMRTLMGFLENHIARLEIESVTARLTPPGSSI
jgi:hypothetical protein